MEYYYDKKTGDYLSQLTKENLMITLFDEWLNNVYGYGSLDEISDYDPIFYDYLNEHYAVTEVYDWNEREKCEEAERIIDEIKANVRQEYRDYFQERFVKIT